MTPLRLVLVGRVAGAFGVTGEVRIAAFTADPLAVLAYGPLLAGDGRVVLTPASGRADPKGAIVRAPEVATREQAQALRGVELHVPRAALPPADDDEFYLADLIGLSVRSPGGKDLGQVASVRNFGAGDLLEIQPPGGDSWWIAFTREAVPDIDIAAGFLVVEPPAD